MVIYENYTIGGKNYIKAFSNNHKYITLGGLLYSVVFYDASLSYEFTEGSDIVDEVVLEDKIINIKKSIEALRDAAVLPSTKAIYEAILDLFKVVA